MREDIRLKLVGKLIKEQANWVIGGYENSVADRHIEEMPTVEELEAEIYHEVMKADRVMLAGGWKMIKKDIRFLGTETIKKLVAFHTAKVLEES